MHVSHVELDREGLRLGDLGRKVATVGLVVGVAGLAASLLLVVLGMASMERFLRSYLVSFAFFLTITLGSLFFVVLQHLVRAGWSVVVRRLAEAMAMNMPLMLVLAVPVVLGAHSLYHWTDTAHVATDPLLTWKQPYLNLPFFTLRLALYFAVWCGTAWYFWKRSTAQDLSGDPRLTMGMERTAGPAMVAFALTVNFASFDLLMSLDPHWYSTIFGVYIFSGGTLGFLAMLSILVPLLQRSGRLGAVTDEHYHDMGKLVFAFVVFWAYIGFSQYMLIWYANMPEETGWYAKRQEGGWGSVSLLLLFGHFIFPFVYLISRYVKRRPKLFGPIAAWILLMHYADLYWIVQPEFSRTEVPLHLLDLTVPIGLGGLYIAALALRMRERPLVPEKDPRLAESLAFENA